MNLLENVSIALEGLKLNKMRTFLTMLGIIIGISSVIAIMTIGDAMSNTVSDGFSDFGNNLMAVMVSPNEGYDWGSLSSKDVFPESSVDLIKERFDTRIEDIVISGAGSSGKAINGKNNTPINIVATSSGYKNAYNVEMISGKFIEEDDIKSSREIAVISNKVVEKIYGNKNENILGKEIQIETTNGTKYYTVVGIYKNKEKNLMMGVMVDTSELYIPYTVGNMQFDSGNFSKSLSYLDVLAKDRNDIENLGVDISNLLNSLYFTDNERAHVEHMTLASQLDQVNDVMGTIKLAIGGIAAISLLVGGIGVMNILLVSVTERTREIGVRKALGATNKDIQSQFIIESVIICIIGGTIGVIIGGLGGFGASSLLKSPTLPSVSAVVLAVGFSMAIGIFFGFYPANKAAKLNPIDALRYE